jgi:signal transduction histidine kinase
MDDTVKKDDRTCENCENAPEGEGGRLLRPPALCGPGEVLLLAAAAVLLLMAFLRPVPAAGEAAPFFIAAAALVAAFLWQLVRRAKLRKDIAHLEELTRARICEESARAAAALDGANEKILRYHSLISHGLRIPISIIMGYADILTGKMVTDSGTRDEYLKKMCDKAAYMNEILTYSLIEMRNGADKALAVRKPFELLSLLRGAVDAVREMAAKHGVAIQLVSEKEEIPMSGNALGLSKAFYNIIENAFKYMGRPGNLNITAARLEDGDVFIAFKDDGEGMDEAELEHIFEMNYQGQNGKSGEGLGLWIVKTEVASHGGKVYAKGAPGAGVGVYIVLPSRGEAELM